MAIFRGSRDVYAMVKPALKSECVELRVNRSSCPQCDAIV